MMKDFLRHWKFYLKWFLIGKAHCSVGTKTKKLIKSVHKIVWGFIIISVSLVLGQIVLLLTN